MRGWKKLNKASKSASIDKHYDKASSQELKIDPLMEFLDWLKYILLAALFGLLLVVFVIQRNAVVGDSMLPTLQEHDQLLVEKIGKHFDAIDHGDIITIKTSNLGNHEEGPNIIKRVIGKPGDLIELDGYNVYRNGELLDETYLPADTITPIREQEYAVIELEDDQYYVMGDNRMISKDSRSIGPIPAKNIIGEVLLKIYPLEKIGKP